MKKIFLVLLVLLVVSLLNVGVAGLYRQRNLDGYLAAFLDKQQLLETTPSPKVILIGGSNTAFGFRSEMIAERLGRPVVNMGLQGALGIRFLLNSIEPYIGDGDVILIAPEYENFFSGFRGGDTLLQLLLLSPQSARYVTTLDEIGRLIVAAPAVHTTGIKNLLLDKVFHCKTCFREEEVYRRDAFNTSGDYVENDGSYKDEIPEFTLDPISNRNYQQEIARLNSFLHLVESRHAKAFFVYPSINSISDEYTINQLSKLVTSLKQELLIPILGSPIDYQFADGEMFNTWYHLNQAGAERNTRNILARLCAVMPDSCQ